MTSAYCGIDFGTSNSTVGIIRGDSPALAPVEGDKSTIPSALFFGARDRGVHYGRAAMTEYVHGEEGRLMRSLKSVLGTALMRETTRINNRPVPFPEIIGTFLGELKRKAEQALGQPVRSVVLGRPVHFVDDDEAADRSAQDQLEQIARAQGFAEIDFQYEPIAAALDYEQAIASEKIALIVDIGGGTSDFSVIRVSPDKRRLLDRKDDILANTGIHIGGTDFDRLLSLAAVMPHLGLGSPMKDKGIDVPTSPYNDLATWHKINFLYTNKTMTALKDIAYHAARPDLIERLIRVVDQQLGHDLAIRVEQAKIGLSADETVPMALEAVERGLEIAVARGSFHDAIADAVGKVTARVEATVAEAGLTAADIHTVFMTGGSTAVPLVRGTIMALFPNAELVEGDKFGSVGMGLGLDARRKFG